MNHPILVFPVHPTSLSKLLKLAELLRLMKIECVFLVATQSVKKSIKRIENAGYEHIDLPLPSRNQTIASQIKSIFRLWKRERDLEYLGQKNSGVFSYIRFLKQKFFYLRLQEHYRDELEFCKNAVHENIDLDAFEKIIVSGDRSLGYETILLTIAEKSNVPCIIPPISTSINPSDFAQEKLRKSENHDVTDNRFFRNEWPKQCLELANRSVSFYEFWRVKVLSDLGVLPPSPWTLGGGRSRKFLIGNGLDATRYIDNGLDMNRVTVTGDPEFDELHAAFIERTVSRSQLVSKYELDSSLPIIIVGMPQLYEHNLLSYEDHMDVISIICDGIRERSVNVLTSLHPKMDVNNYQFLESKYNFTILEENLSTCLPVADIYVSCQGSSTWIWSVLCEVPMIVCDWYGSDADISKPEYGVSVIKDSKAYAPELSKLLQDPSYYQCKKQQCIDTKPLICEFDGKSGDRVIEEILS